jgi:SAM-dependent methyltransferase
LAAVALSHPQKVHCNICGWKGRYFLSDSWHRHIKCPCCGLEIRHRLFLAALQNIDDLSFDQLIHGKRVLHFAPEEIVSRQLLGKAASYVTADLLQRKCDLRLDMSHMPEIGNATFDVVIAFDVLEHVPDYHAALEEVHRILSPWGVGIFTVPQPDDLGVTYENPAIVTPSERAKHFGQWDHLRLFGCDFPVTVEGKGFAVRVVDEATFPQDIRERCVLAPPQLSKRPLVTNFRKIFFCQKISADNLLREA